MYDWAVPRPGLCCNSRELKTSLPKLRATGGWRAVSQPWGSGPGPATCISPSLRVTQPSSEGKVTICTQSNQKEEPEEGRGTRNSQPSPSPEGTVRMTVPFLQASEGEMRGADGGGGEDRGQEHRGVPGTHRSLLQTGGRKEARFSSTQVFTLTRRSMAARGAALWSVCLGPSEGRGSAQPPMGRLINQHPGGQRAGQLPLPPGYLCGWGRGLVLWPLSDFGLELACPPRRPWPALAKPCSLRAGVE